MAMSVLLVGCQSTKWGPVGTTDTEGVVVSNGSVVVQQGNHLYYVNGYADVNTIKQPKDNYFGKEYYRGNIMKSTINSDGTLSDTAVVVPKMFFSKSSMAGIYIFGDWIYYTSPSTRTNNLNEVQITTLEFMRTKTDGTKTQTIGYLADSINYVFTQDCLVYYNNNTLTKINYDDNKILKTEVVAEEISAVTFTHGSSNIFFTKASQQEKLRNNELYVSVGGAEPICLINGDTFAQTAGEPTFQEQKTIAVVKYDKDENVLFFTAKDNGGVDAETTYTCGYKFGEKFEAVTKANVIKYANTALSSIVCISSDNSLIAVESEGQFVKYEKKSFDFIDTFDKIKLGKLTSAPTIMFTKNVDGIDYIYYNLSDMPHRINYSGDVFIEEKLTDETGISSNYTPTVIGNYIYFMGTKYSYLYRMDFTKYSLTNNTVNYMTSELVSGYVTSDKTSTGIVPKFMEKTDIDSYIADNKIEE